MSDDPSYQAFLDKANQDPSAGVTAASRDRGTWTSQSSDPSVIPASLQDIASTYTYTSDTDAPFEPVFFSYGGTGLPDSSEFKKCLGRTDQEGAVEELSVDEFDPRGEYADVIKRVKEAAAVGEGVEVKVFRVEVSKTRCEYYILTLGDGKLVGVVAKAVES